ncbi:MAG: patatin-like phospholipase family protein [Cytophagales bacterium]|nr:patatin-like phospholipase family protein [Cytophagales bacterium]
MSKQGIKARLGRWLGMETPRTGIALGGGGAKGFIHLGVIKALYEEGVRIDEIAGTSAGAIAGALIASGKDPITAHEILKTRDFFGYSKFNIPRVGLFGLDGLTNLIETEIEAQTFDELEIPFYASATNLHTGKIEYLNEGSLARAVTASSSIPFLFKPMHINGSIYSDGGIIDNLPITPLQKTCNRIIAVNISPIEEKEKLNSIFTIAVRTFEITVNARAVANKHKCSLFIEPEGIGNYDLFDIKKADELFNLGYEHTKQLLASKKKSG